MLAGACKYSKTPANNTMIESLKNTYQKVELNIEDYVLFSKNGFTPEVKEHTDKNLSLLTNTDLSTLLDGLSDKDLLLYKNKKY